MHALDSDEQTALIIALSPGQCGDAPAGRGLLRRLRPGAGEPALIIGRVYRLSWRPDPTAGVGYRPLVPPPSYRNSSWSYDRDLYRRRNEVECFFCRLRRFR